MNNNVNKLVKQYYDNREIYLSLKNDIEDILTRIIKTNHFRISNMAIRIKEEKSLKKKILYKDFFSGINEITDVVACRIITLFEDDVERIYQCIKDNFEIVEVRDKRKKSNQDRIDYGYNSLHLLIKFTKERCQLIEYAAYKDIVFELQIRTTLQHSWAEIEHGLGYKSQYEIPKKIRRKLTRLSATLELLDEEFVRIAKEVEEYNNGINHIEKILKTDINVNSLIQYINTSKQINQLLSQLHKQYQFDFERDRELFSQSRLIQRYNYMGYSYIHELDDFIEKHFDEILKLSKERIISYNRNHRLNIYEVLVWISLVMLASEGLNDPEEVFSSKTIQQFKDIASNDK